MNTLSDFKRRLWNEGALDYAIIDANSKVDFYKTEKEVKEALKKIPSYNHPKVYQAKKEVENVHCVVIEMRENWVKMQAENLTQAKEHSYPFEHGVNRLYFLV